MKKKQTAYGGRLKVVEAPGSDMLLQPLKAVWLLGAPCSDAALLV